MRRTRILGAAVAMGLALLLAGCDQFLAEPMAYTRVDGTPVVRICIPLTITEVTVVRVDEEREEVGGATAIRTTETIVWSATGRLDAPAGFEFGFGQPLPELPLVSSAETEYPAGEYRVEMAVESDRGGDWRATAWLDADDLRSGSWLDSYGDPVDPPCSQAPCRPGWSCFNDWPDPTGEPTMPAPTWTPSRDLSN